jgi:short-subunit dehydrogenase
MGPREQAFMPHDPHAGDFLGQKTAIVIGASSGIGRELARILAHKGYRLAIMARRTPLLDELNQEEGGTMLVQALDAAEADQARATLTDVIQRLGGVDLVVISSGTGDINDSLAWEIENRAIRVNVTGFAALANAAMHHFLTRKAGHLVGITSIAALRGGRESPAYNATKAFQANYLEGLRQKVCHARLPITITDIQPGFVQTAMAKGEGIFWSAPVAKAAAQVYDAIERRAHHAYITKRWRLIGWILRFLPGPLYERL